MAGQGAPVRLDGRAEDRTGLPDHHHAHEAEAPAGHCRQTLPTQLAIPRQQGDGPSFDKNHEKVV